MTRTGVEQFPFIHDISLKRVRFDGKWETVGHKNVMARVFFVALDNANTKSFVDHICGGTA